MDRLDETVTSVAGDASGLLPVGSSIDEFSILRPLGAGAFAQVYLARQESIQRLVALKVSARAGSEPRTLARLDHANIVRVYDQRVLATDQTHLVYMEYVPCGTLAELVQFVRSIPNEQRSGKSLLQYLDKTLTEIGQVGPEFSSVRQWLEQADWASTVAWIGLQLAEALDYAHRHQVLHRDIKPANVLLTSEGIPKLADFNVSVAAAECEAEARRDFGGTLAYMSPEQLQAIDPRHSRMAGDLDGRSDLFSLSLLLWELWLGDRPWMDSKSNRALSDAAAVYLDFRQVEVTPPRCNEPTERALCQVLLRCLSFHRDRRPAHGSELAGQLKLALHPEAAYLFHPTPHGIRSWLLRMPVWLMTGLLILLPNVLAGIYNFSFNQSYILSKYPEIAPLFNWLATGVNSIAYPMGVFFLWYFTHPISTGLKRVAEGRKAGEKAIHSAWELGQRAAMIGGSIWAIAGVIFSTVLKVAHSEFTNEDAIHFLVSLLLCGGIAWTVPFFGGAAAGVLLYYPSLVSPTMHDAKFIERRRRLKVAGGRYLLAAAMIPLLAAALVTDRSTLLITLTLTAIGVAVSFIAYQRFESDFEKLALAISERSNSLINK